MRWKTRKPRHRGRTRLGLRLVLWAGGLVGAFYLSCTVSLVLLRAWNPVSTGVQVQRRIEAVFSDRSDYEKRQTFVHLEQIPLHIRRAVIAAEDGSFYQHSGVDWGELVIVFREYRQSGRLRGASTISQQLVKNLYFTTRRSPVRKLLEYTLAPLAELILPKDRILELYLNVIEWGPGVYGVEAAAQYHYGVSVSELGRRRGARLAACIPSPRIWKPQRMDKYSAEILERMRQRGW